jgi:hypothetical protein
VICDNQATCHIIENLIYHKRTKHIKLDCHFICEKLVEGIIKTDHVSSKDQRADILTKFLSRVPSIILYLS